jgi:protein-L-isoaspartate(D-aspartate) O-methyltransferase
MNLIDSLIKEGWLKTPRIIEAFRQIKRVDFLPAAPEVGEPRPLYGRDDSKDLAELNEALPIGYGQTISQPLVVAFMIELLDPRPGEKILDIGSGSGWTSALLAQIVGKKGKVIAIDIIPELVEFGKKNVSKYNFIEKGIVEFICADGSKGYQKEAPFDKILASASARELPKAWKEQLKVGGRIVTPIGTSIWLFAKKSENEFEEIEYPGFVFVPLISKQ